MAFVQSKAVQNGVAGLTCAATYTSPVVPGNLLVAAVGFNSADSVSVADSVNGAWVPIGLPHTGTGGVSASRLQFFYFAGTAKGTPVVTATASGSHVPFGIAIFEYSGENIVDVTVAYADSLATTTPTTPTITTHGAADAILAAVITGGTSTGVNSPFTFREGANWGGNGTADDDAAVPGSYSATFTQASADTMLGIVAFQAAETHGFRQVRIPNPRVGPMALRQRFPRRRLYGDTPVVAAGGTFDDSGSGSITLSGTGVETHVHTASGSGSLTLSGSGVETHTHSRSAAGTITLSGSGTESQTHSRSAAGSLTLSGSGTETHTHSSSGSGSITLSGSGVENYGYVDAGVGSIVFSGSGTETQTHTASRSGSIVLSGRGVESYSPPGGASAPADTLDQLHQIATWS